MRHIADRFAAVLDANVLYPFLMRDVLLSLAGAGLYRPRWSADIMDEWTSRLVASKPHLADAVARTAALMDRAFPEATVDGYRELIAGLALPDPDDRHVLAAAIRGQAAVIVTCNLRDFPQAALAPFDIEARSPDDFVCDTFQLYEVEALAALREMRAHYANPAMTADDLIVALMAGGMVAFAATLRPHVASL